jgi:plastocyanin
MSDPNRPREDLVLPILIPVGALAAIGVILFLFSRVLLHVSHVAATVTALVTAASVLGIASLIASRKQVTGAAVFTMLGGVAGVAMFAGGIALLIGQPAEEGGGVVVALTAPQGAAVSGFAATSLTAPATTPFTLDFDNQDPSVQHDVVIATGPAGGSSQVLFDGTVVTGPTTIAYAVDALDPGTYAFYCKIHPTTMKGTLTVKEGPPPPSGTGGGPSISAAAQQFSTDTLTFQAGKPTTLHFENNDGGQTHNFSIYTDQSATTPEFQGENTTGPQAVDYEIPKLPAGTYFFRCDVHPTTMTGTLTVE